MNILGKTINGYAFEEALGSGSFGSVYRVSKNGMYFAAKVLSEIYVLEEFKKEQNRITREIDILKKVNHSNLIKYGASCEAARRCVMFPLDDGNNSIVISKLLTYSRKNPTR